MKPFKLFILFHCFIISGTYAQPSDTDYLLGYGGNLLILSTEFIFKKDLAPTEPKWSVPNTFDIYFRDGLKWDNSNHTKAALYSDILLRGITLPSIFWSSYESGYKYGSYVLLQMQVFAATGFFTYMSKFIMARQRPYSYFKTKEAQFPEDNLSFFSGHASFSFAIATSTGYLLQKSYAHYSGLIWSSAVLIAAATGYLRIAADRHYMSDVLTGMVIGSTIGYLLARNQGKKFFDSKNNSKPDFQMNFTIPL